ncbi:MAG: tetratricopeptide repeat protein [Acidobacteriota bacterium]|nr:tetratricopeptide repeat protein [Acidobacteriota bacterium]
MSRSLLATVLVIGLTAVGIAWWQNAESNPWTTDSEKARIALEQGWEAYTKLYHSEAAELYERAVEADPQWVVPRLMLARMLPFANERRRELVDAARQADLEALSDRERFLVEYNLAMEDGQRPQARRLVEAFNEDHPEDPFGLHIRGGVAMFTGDFEQAEELYQRLVETEPNWVNAQNMLGYLAMRRGDFQEAENRFRTFQFVAPDQANPHDSLAELMALRGRYQEAEDELQKALELRPDFLPAFNSLLRLSLLDQDLDLARDTVRRLREVPDFPPGLLKRGNCLIELLQTSLENRPPPADAGSTDPDNDCHYWYLPLALHQRQLLADGRRDQALALEQGMGEMLAESLTKEMRESQDQALLSHLQGYRLAYEGDLDGALEKLQAVEDLLGVENLESGQITLVNRLVLAQVLERAGDEDAARRVWNSMTAINPRIPELEPLLGLPRPG